MKGQNTEKTIKLERIKELYEESRLSFSDALVQMEKNMRQYLGSDEIDGGARSGKPYPLQRCFARNDRNRRRTSEFKRRFQKLVLKAYPAWKNGTPRRNCRRRRIFCKRRFGLYYGTNPYRIGRFRVGNPRIWRS